jgi:Ca-activated chloride channel family protein
MKAIYNILILFVAFGITPSKLYGQDLDSEKIRILFIFDASNSMNAQWQQGSKMTVAKKLLTNVVDELRGVENTELALRVYGHQFKILPGQQNCDDTNLEVAFSTGDGNIDKIKNKIRSIQAKGTTPIARSLEYSAEDFPECNNCRNVIILITDGIEACDEDPCAVSRALRAKGIKLKPFVIGIGLDTSYLGQFNCIGEFLSAETEDSFKSVLNFVVSQALNNTTVQVNLLDINKKPSETDVTMSFYDQKTNQLVYTYKHTLDRDRSPDTLSIDPLHTYRLVVHTTPEVTKENIKVLAGKHNTILLDAPRGHLDLNIQGYDNIFTGINCIVRKGGDMRTINVQQMNFNHKYIVGKYDLEILTLPRLYINDIEIKQNRHTNITIPKNGNALINKGAGPAQIFVIREGENEWVCNLKNESAQQNIELLPGKYKIVFRHEKSFSTAHSIEKTFKIVSGYSENITL